MCTLLGVYVPCGRGRNIPLALHTMNVLVVSTYIHTQLVVLARSPLAEGARNYRGAG